MPATAVSPTPLRATGGVSGNNLKGSAWSLREAETLDLLFVAVAPEARALGAALLPLLEATEARTRPRGPKERAKAVEALDAVLGGVLTAALTKCRMVHRAMSRSSFEGRIGYRVAKQTLDGLTRAGFLVCYPGIRFLRSGAGGDDVAAGMTTRYAASDHLYALAASRGITADNVSVAYVRTYPSSPPKVPHLLTLRSIDARRGRTSRGGGLGVPLAIGAKDATASALRAQVKLANVALAGFRWGNCQPPRVYRAFREDWTFGGRWVVAGVAPLQTMSAAARLLVTIDGGSVSEIDATASQLTILAGLSGIAQLPPDPYSLPGYSRNAVKRAVIVTLGNGRLLTRWPQRTLEDYPELADVDLKALTVALAAAYPFILDPGEGLGVSRERVALRLQAIEASILTRALLPLWQDRVPAVPLHDGILCPAGHAARVVLALKAAYSEGASGAVVGVTPPSIGRGWPRKVAQRV